MSRKGTLSSFLPLNEESSAVIPKVPELLQRSFSAWGLRRNSYVQSLDDGERGPRDERQPLRFPDGLMTPQMRSMRLIGNNNPRYQWEKYYTSPEALKAMKKPTRAYYERNNALIARYLYIDRLLDSELPHTLIDDYNRTASVDVPPTISEESNSPVTPESTSQEGSKPSANGYGAVQTKLKRTPKNLYRLPDDQTPLLQVDGAAPDLDPGDDEDVDSGSPIVRIAMNLNLANNILLFVGKCIVTYLSSSVSVLASLVDAGLDLLSSGIIFVTVWLGARPDRHNYPIGRQTLEPVGILVFSVIMITSFFQVGIESINRLMAADHRIVELGTPALAIMGGTVVLKGFCWFWCRLIKNSSVQALAQDCETDIVFNTFSIIFPLVGQFFRIWWLDSLGGLVLSAYVIINWGKTSLEHIRHLTGAAATADQRNVLLYLTMRFAKTIRSIQGLQVYHAGDKLNVEVDIILDGDMSLKDSHDLSESLQYVLESVPAVGRAFVHSDYNPMNLPSHMNQQE